jgi:putative ubiquitin-RnfH superfamily antitoxin RatB of RatAB toxin-antitoxin module
MHRSSVQDLPAESGALLDDGDNRRAVSFERVFRRAARIELYRGGVAHPVESRARSARRSS